MGSTGSYGQSFAMKHLEMGRYDDALVEANKAIERDAEDPEAMLDRAHIHFALERFEDGIADLRACVKLDEVACIVDDSVVDDALFSALVAWGKKVAPADAARAVAIIESYPTILGGGGHGGEVATWVKRFRGEREEWVKAR